MSLARRLVHALTARKRLQARYDSLCNDVLVHAAALLLHEHSDAETLREAIDDHARGLRLLVALSRAE